MAGDMAAVSLTVNGKPVTADVDPRTLLVQLLRENLRLTGTHVGCDTSQCGACVVHRRRQGGQILHRARGAARRRRGHRPSRVWRRRTAPLHPMQEAFRENHGLQCGYCTPGMIMTAVDMVRRKGHELDERTIREELEGNICRCTGYHNIVKVDRGRRARHARQRRRQRRPPNRTAASRWSMTYDRTSPGGRLP